MYKILVSIYLSIYLLSIYISVCFFSNASASTIRTGEKGWTFHFVEIQANIAIIFHHADQIISRNIFTPDCTINYTLIMSIL